MIDQAQIAADYTSTIEYVFDGVLDEPARVFGEEKAGLKLAARDGHADWALAARDGLRRTPAVIRLGSEGEN